MNPIKLPFVYCPFPYVTHPNVVETEKLSTKWMEKWGLFWTDTQRQRMACTACGQLAGLMYPAGSNELLQIGADYTIWTFAFDDECCDEGPLSQRPMDLIRAMGHMQRAIESPELPIDESDRYAMSLRDIRIRLDRYATPAHVSRFVETQRTYFMAEMCKTSNARPSLNDYVVLRLYGGGAMVFPTLSHIIAGIDLADVDLADRRLRALLEMAASVVVWDSDFYSYGKEHARNVDDKGHNLIDVIGCEYGLSVEQSLIQAIGMRDRVLSLFLRLRAETMKNASPEIAAYIDGMCYYVRGVLEWSRNNPRYKYLNGLDGEPCYIGGEVSDTPSDDNLEPLPVPSIAWWWHYDPSSSAKKSRK